MSRLSDLPSEVRTLIAQHLDIPDEPPVHVQLYTTELGSYDYVDPFNEDAFDSLYDECQKRATYLDMSRRWVENQKKSTSQERHFEALEQIQNTPGLSFDHRAAQLQQEWRHFTTKTELLFKYMQIFKFEEAILNRKLAEYRRQNVYAV